MHPAIILGNSRKSSEINLTQLIRMHQIKINQTFLIINQIILANNFVHQMKKYKNEILNLNKFLIIESNNHE